MDRDRKRARTAPGRQAAAEQQQQHQLEHTQAAGGGREASTLDGGTFREAYQGTRAPASGPPAMPDPLGGGDSGIARHGSPAGLNSVVAAAAVDAGDSAFVVAREGAARKNPTKDRHSKVMTAKGERDRRVRLAKETAIQFYDLQYRLDIQQPSKVVEWLMQQAKPAIDELPRVNSSGTQTPAATSSRSSVRRTRVANLPLPPGSSSGSPVGQFSSNSSVVLTRAVEPAPPAASGIGMLRSSNFPPRATPGMHQIGPRTLPPVLGYQEQGRLESRRALTSSSELHLFQQQQQQLQRYHDHQAGNWFRAMNYDHLSGTITGTTNLRGLAAVCSPVDQLEVSPPPAYGSFTNLLTQSSPAELQPPTRYGSIMGTLVPQRLGLVTQASSASSPQQQQFSGYGSPGSAAHQFPHDMVPPGPGTGRVQVYDPYFQSPEVIMPAPPYIPPSYTSGSSSHRCQYMAQPTSEQFMFQYPRSYNIPRASSSRILSTGPLSGGIYVHQQQQAADPARIRGSFTGDGDWHASGSEPGRRQA